MNKELINKHTDLILELDDTNSNTYREMLYVIFHEYLKLSVLKLDRKDQEIIATMSYMNKCQPEFAFDDWTVGEVLFRFKNYMNEIFKEPYALNEQEEYANSLSKLRKIEKRAIIQNLLLNEDLEYSNEDISKVTNISIEEVSEIVDDLNKESAFLNELEGV